MMSQRAKNCLLDNGGTLRVDLCVCLQVHVRKYKNQFWTDKIIEKL